ncbi:hypothetical protein JTE90_027101 [Oedothorax gibbosus]|uniref:THAP-type domain-containing protein n=1 Tax=Oedothorax gibbosus TaxID=931172 RepID=A0AAV6TS39_9ARAC|nr:hypothetical protein JTE90_027101 [Oedothorax gibbosus]
MSCCAYGCTNRHSKKVPGITFHRFPKNVEKRLAWEKAIRREGYEPNKYSYICSEHFPEHMIDRTSLSCVRLRDNAVPEIFKAFPPHLQKKSKERKPPKERKQPKDGCLKNIEVQDLPVQHYSLNLPVNTPTTPDDMRLPDTSACPQSTETDHLQAGLQLPTEGEAFYKRKAEALSAEVEVKNKKIKVLQQKVRRYTKKVKDLSSLLSHLQSENLVDEDSLNILNTLSKANTEIFSRLLSSTNMNAKYSEELRTFALTLHFYSPRAYEYVRTSFNLALPHQRTLSRWYQHIDGAPGITREALNVLELKIKSSEHPLYFSLIMDEMSIRQQVEFDGKECHGYVNHGNYDSNNDDDSLPLAKDAFVLLVVCINGHWKLPVGYFLTDGLNSCELTILSVPSKVSSVDVINITTQPRLSITTPIDDGDDPESVNEFIFTDGMLSECSKDIVQYIAGFVTKKLLKTLKCQECLNAVRLDGIMEDDISAQPLISFKSLGNLVHPSKEVTKICIETEKFFRECVVKTSFFEEKKKLVCLPNMTKVYEHVCSRSYFPNLIAHQFDSDPLDNHLLHLIRAIVQTYMKVRLSYYYKNLNSKQSLRQWYTKFRYVLFVLIAELEIGTASSPRVDMNTAGVATMLVCPESRLSANVSFDGKAFDAWSFGVMVVEIFTHFYLKTT